MEETAKLENPEGGEESILAWIDECLRQIHLKELEFDQRRREIDAQNEQINQNLAEIRRVLACLAG
jgi:hypothetical protein